MYVYIYINEVGALESLLVREQKMLEDAENTSSKITY